MEPSDARDLVITIRLHPTDPTSLLLLSSLRSKVHHPQYGNVLRGWTVAEQPRPQDH